MTAFIESLSSDQRSLVARNTKGAKRPSYFDAALAVLAQRAVFSGVVPEVADTVQISEDLEAVLILLATSHKQALLASLQHGMTFHVDPAEAELMAEVVAVRANNYAVVNADAVAPQQQYTKVKTAVGEFLENSRTTSGIENLVPDLDRLFGTLNQNVVDTSRPEVLALHSHITDNVALVQMTGNTSSRQKELLSWINVIKTYL